MKLKTMPLRTFALSAVALAVMLPAAWHAPAQEAKAPYATMAPIDQYLMADRDAEIALARTAAPPSISHTAEVLVLGRDGYTTAVKGGNGFVCLVERGFAAATVNSVFWNPKNRSPICLNAAATRTDLPIVQMKAKLALEGKSKAEIAQAVTAAFESGELPALEPGAMCYMMSKEQYLNDSVKNWHPHLMWFVPGAAAAKWGGNVAGSPVIAADDPEERMTIMMVWADHWSDGSPAPQVQH